MFPQTISFACESGTFNLGREAVLVAEDSDSFAQRKR